MGKRTRRCAVLLALTALLIAACGRQSTPPAPETARTEAPKGEGEVPAAEGVPRDAEVVPVEEDESRGAEDVPSGAVRSVLDGFPARIREGLPEGYETINEFLTATLSGDISNLAEMTVRFRFQTLYGAG